MKNTFYIVILSILFAGTTKAIIIRHEVDDQKYLELGEEYSSSVAYIAGCAGTLLDSNWILTAAHCVMGREQNIFSAIHMGSQYRIEKILIHPELDIDESAKTPLKFDIALIQLKDSIKNGTPAHLYQLNDEKGKSVIFVGRGGFGTGLVGPTQGDGKQRGATNVVTSTSKYFIEFKFDAPETATEMEGISGPGDSGGPAFIIVDSQLHVAGVSSYQIGNDFDEGTYGVLEYYTRVSTSYEWINSIIENAKP